MEWGFINRTIGRIWIGGNSEIFWKYHTFLVPQYLRLGIFQNILGKGVILTTFWQSVTTTFPLYYCQRTQVVSKLTEIDRFGEKICHFSWVCILCKIWPEGLPAAWNISEKSVLISPPFLMVYVEVPLLNLVLSSIYGIEYIWKHLSFVNRRIIFSGAHFKSPQFSTLLSVTLEFQLIHCQLIELRSILSKARSDTPRVTRFSNWSSGYFSSSIVLK